MPSVLGIAVHASPPTASQREEPTPTRRTGEPPAWSAASDRADRRWRRSLGLGLLFAVVVHLAVLLLSRSEILIPDLATSAAGPDAGDVRAAAGGGSGLEAIAVRVQTEQPQVVETTPVPVPVPEEVVVRPDPPKVEIEERPAPAAVPSLPGTGRAGDGGEQGTATGPGTATGTGEGAGGTGETGASGAPMPTPRGMILPPADRPRSARGQEIAVWVWVNERGRVVADSTRLDPPTADSRYNQRLKRSAAEWVFEPARQAGRAVAAWYRYEMIL